MYREGAAGRKHSAPAACYLKHHATSTAVYIGLGGWKNGASLKAAEDDGFDILVTGDSTVQYEQNMAGRTIAIVSLSAHNWRIIRPHVEKIVMAVDLAESGTVTRVDCGAFVRQRRPL